MDNINVDNVYGMFSFMFQKQQQQGGRGGEEVKQSPFAVATPAAAAAAAIPLAPRASRIPFAARVQPQPAVSQRNFVAPPVAIAAAAAAVVVPQEPLRVPCGGRTQKGEPCKMTTSAEHGYCRFHMNQKPQDYEPSDAVAEAMAMGPRVSCCRAINITNQQQCSRSPKANCDGMCSQHHGMYLQNPDRVKTAF
jgi:hypothetical protein